MTKTRLPDAALDYFRSHGARGGKIGSANLTAAERKTRAINAGRASAAARAKKKHAKKTKTDD